jgi:hypothetical protein
LGRKLVGDNEMSALAAPIVSFSGNPNSGSYTVNWGASPAATSYTLQERVGSGSWATIQTSSTRSKALNGKGNGSYDYRVRACNAGGCGPWSSTATTTVLLEPATPASINVPTTSSGSIAVSWSPSATATSYNLVQRLGTGSWSTVYTGAATSSTRTVTASGSYTFEVRACNASGCSAYKLSSAVTVTIPPASAPTLTVPANSSDGSYTGSWTAVTGATSYTLQEKMGSGSWATIQTSSARSKTFSGKDNGSYGYRVQACNTGGCGIWSNTRTITVALIPAIPGTPSVTRSGSTYKPKVNVSWSGVADATSYQLEETHPQDGVELLNVGANTNWSQLILASGVVKFRVKACSSAGCSAFSGYGSITLNSSSSYLEQANQGTENTEEMP